MAFFPELSGAFDAFLKDAAGKPCVIVGHARPDGDCIGSQVALRRMLAALGSDAVCVNTDPVPARLAFLAQPGEFVPIDSVRGSGRLPLFVDCADAIRPTKAVLEAVGTPFAQFDHHLSNIGYASRHNLLDAQASATAEILAGLAFDRGLAVDAGVAAALYAGILTDTGRFCFPATSRRVFEIAGLLMDAGASPSAIAGEIYERQSQGQLQLLQHFLSSLTYHAGGRICCGILPEGIFERTGTTPEDTEGLVNYARDIDGVEVGLLLEQRGAFTKGSLRSRSPEVRMDTVAARFNGGGHACAAGFRMPETADTLLPKVVSAVTPLLPA